MVRKLVFWLVLVPLAIVILMFAVANREIVTVSFDPFSATRPAASVSVPLFVLIFSLVILGVIIGGIAAWLQAIRLSPRGKAASFRRRGPAPRDRNAEYEARRSGRRAATGRGGKARLSPALELRHRSAPCASFPPTISRRR